MLHTGNLSSWFTSLKELSIRYSLPEPLQLLCQPLPKLKYKNLIRSKILQYSHHILVQQTKAKKSLKFLRPEFIPLGSGPHPIFLSCGNSSSATQAATVVAEILSGRYRDDYLCSKWTNTSGACTNCGFYPGDCVHYLSLQCPALSVSLQNTLNYSLSLLPTFPDLSFPVYEALSKTPFEWSVFVLDPVSSPSVVPIKTGIWPPVSLSSSQAHQSICMDNA